MKSYGLRSGCLSYKVGCTLEESLGLRSWCDGPNWVLWIFGRCGEIPKGLAVLKPLLFLFGGGVGERDEDDYCGGSGQFTFTGKKSSSYVIPVIGMSRN